MAHIIFNKTLLCSFLGGMISVSSLAQNMSTPSKNASVSSTNAEEIQAKVYTLEQCVNEAVSNNLKLRNDVLQVNLRHNETKTTKIQVENALQTVCDLLAQVISTLLSSNPRCYPS